jgi:carboxylate-amine ligase
MCDGIPTLREVSALAALAQCLVHSFDERIDRGETLPVPKEWITRENKWRAARFGVDAEVVVDDTGHTTPLRESLDRLVDTLGPTAEQLGCAAELSSVLDILKTGPSYARQRAVVAGGGSLADVVGSLRREYATDQPGA